MSAEKFTPMIITGSTIILSNNAGSFNVCGCPDPEELAMFIHDACNRDHLFDEMVKELTNMIDTYTGYLPVPERKIALFKAHAILAKVRK